MWKQVQKSDKLLPPKSCEKSTLEVIHAVALALANEIFELFKFPIGMEQRHLKNKHVFQKK